MLFLRSPGRVPGPAAARASLGEYEAPIQKFYACHQESPSGPASRLSMIATSPHRIFRTLSGFSQARQGTAPKLSLDKHKAPAQKIPLVFLGSPRWARMAGGDCCPPIIFLSFQACPGNDCFKTDSTISNQSYPVALLWLLSRPVHGGVFILPSLLLSSSFRGGGALSAEAFWTSPAHRCWKSREYKLPLGTRAAGDS